MAPPFPLIVITGKHLDIVKEEHLLKQASLLWLSKGTVSETLYFDGFSKLWKSRIKPETFKPTLLKRLLAETFYNPVLQIDRVWTQADTYTIDKLKELIIQCINEDDDILTQFIEADNLKARIQDCQDFFDIIGVLTRYVFDPDEERIYEEFPPED